MRYITNEEIKRYADEIIDEETGMTMLDYLEWSGACDDWVIVD